MDFAVSSLTQIVDGGGGQEVQVKKFQTSNNTQWVEMEVSLGSGSHSVTWSYTYNPAGVPQAMAMTMTTIASSDEDMVISFDERRRELLNSSAGSAYIDTVSFLPSNPVSPIPTTMPTSMVSSLTNAPTSNPTICS